MLIRTPVNIFFARHRFQLFRRAAPKDIFRCHLFMRYLLLLLSFIFHWSFILSPSCHSPTILIIIDDLRVMRAAPRGVHVLCAVQCYHAHAAVWCQKRWRCMFTDGRYVRGAVANERVCSDPAGVWRGAAAVQQGSRVRAKRRGRHGVTM